MSERAQALANEIQRVANDLASTIGQASDEKFRAMCSGEGWSTGVTAHHVGAAHLGDALQFILALARGGPVPPITPEILNQANAQHAVDHASCTRQEVVELLRANGASTAAAIARLTDDQLDRSQPMAFAGGAPVSVEQMIRAIMLNSSRDHLASIQAAG